MEMHMNTPQQYILIVRNEAGAIVHMSQHTSSNAATIKAEKLGAKSKVNLFGHVYLHNYGDQIQSWQFVTNICA